MCTLFYTRAKKTPQVIMGLKIRVGVTICELCPRTVCQTGKTTAIKHTAVLETSERRHHVDPIKGPPNVVSLDLFLRVIY